MQILQIKLETETAMFLFTHLRLQIASKAQAGLVNQAKPFKQLNMQLRADRVSEIINAVTICMHRYAGGEH